MKLFWSCYFFPVINGLVYVNKSHFLSSIKPLISEEYSSGEIRTFMQDLIWRTLKFSICYCAVLIVTVFVYNFVCLQKHHFASFCCFAVFFKSIYSNFLRNVNKRRFVRWFSPRGFVFEIKKSKKSKIISKETSENNN